MTVAYQPGRSALFKYGTGSGPITYTTVGGLRNVDISIDTGAVDVTNKDSGGYQTMLAGAGVWKGSISAQGLFDNSVSLKAVVASTMPPQVSIPGQVIMGNGDTYTGTFLVTQLKRTGTYQDAETYDITLASSGTCTFVPGS